jgi:hypothetical protein
MKLIPFKPLKEMYIMRSASGSLQEGRQGKHYGTTMRPSAMVRFCDMYNFKNNPTTEPWAPGKLLTQYEYTIFLKTFLPLEAFTKTTITQDNVDKTFNRLETISYWNASYQEILRHLALGKQLTEMKPDESHTLSKWQEVVKIAQEFESEIRDAFKKYAEQVVAKGDFSFKHYEFYVKEHSQSASPFQRMNEKGEVRGLKWSTILKDDKLMKLTYSIMIKIPQEYLDTQAFFDKHEYVLINIEHAYSALRARRAEYKLLKATNHTLLLIAKKVRDRKAGGIKKLSQIEWVIYKKTDIKREIYKTFYSLIEMISGCKIHPITLLGSKFYKEISEKEEFYCYDLRNAEKQVALLLSFMHFNADLGNPKFIAELAGELYSGVGPTRILNEIVVAIYVRWLRSAGYAITDIWIGGDNFGLLIYINCEMMGLDLFFTNETRILGFEISGNGFGPPSLITDNISNRVSLPKEFSRITWTQGYQHETRILQYVVQNSIYKSDSCKRYIDWVVARKLDDKAEIYDKYTMHNIIASDPILQDSFLDNFSEELNYVRQFFLINNSLKGSTDAHPLIR